MQTTRKNWQTMTITLAAGLLALSASCAGGGAITTPGVGLNLPGASTGKPSTSPGTGGSTVITQPGAGGSDTDINLGGAYLPQIDTPETERFAQLSDPGDDPATAWLKDCLETLPDEGNPSGVFQNDSLQNWAYLIYEGVNEAREQAGLSRMQYLPQLEVLAQAHARDMALRNYFSHDSPGGFLMWDRWQAVDLPYAEYASENAAKGQETVSEVVDGWLHSSKHYENMMDPRNEWCGVGVYFDPADRDMPVHVIMEFAQFRDDPLSHDWYQRGDVFDN